MENLNLFLINFKSQVRSTHQLDHFSIEQVLFK